MRIGYFILDRVSPSQEKIQLKLDLKNSSEALTLNFYHIYFFQNSQCNLVNLGLLNNSGIYYYNKNETVYKVQTRLILVQAK